MNILLDNIIYSKEKQGGVSNYFFEITKYLQQFPEIDIKYYEEKFANLNGCRKELNINEENIIDHPENKSLILARLLPIRVKMEDDFLYHSSFYRALISNKNYVEVTTIYDFVHDYYASRLKRVMHNKLKYGAIKRSKGIICISHNTYTDMLKFCKPKNDQKVAVIHCGVSKDYFPLSASLIEKTASTKIKQLADDGFLLFIGSRANYKNFNFVASLVNELPNIKLVVVGKSFDENEIKLFNADAYSRTIVLKNVSNDELNVLYNRALALLYPSDYEGFGIPVIEAMQAGCPVISLKKSSIPEVAGDAGILLDKLDKNEFKSKIELLKNNEYKSMLIERGILQAKKFSWEKCSNETLDFYKDIYK